MTDSVDAKCYHMLLGMLIIYLYAKSYTVGVDHLLLILPGGRWSGLVRDGLRSDPKTSRLGCVWCTAATGFTAGSRQFADKSAPTVANKRSVARSANITRFCPEGVGADLSAMGCEAALKQATLIVSGAPYVQILLPVPDSSRTSDASRGSFTAYGQNQKRTGV
ncbi:hypothetical protein NVV30_12225 [Pseudomonas syringae]|uniref:hypothetical protein n=1 Tax=Pseudomonas syringae TaxID=317 RepID=UPI00215B6F51|nr:hypothetical protein [Pseudomonas syringae]MCR8719450.1 hypothetical protein [Pseudomonas syringae]